MTLWVLVIIYGVSPWFSGVKNEIVYYDQAACYLARDNVLANQNANKNRRYQSVVAYCKPAHW
jgi:hypothetical protein